MDVEAAVMMLPDVSVSMQKPKVFPTALGGDRTHDLHGVQATGRPLDHQTVQKNISESIFKRCTIDSNSFLNKK